VCYKEFTPQPQCRGAMKLRCVGVQFFRTTPTCPRAAIALNGGEISHDHLLCNCCLPTDLLVLVALMPAEDNLAELCWAAKRSGLHGLHPGDLSRRLSRAYTWQMAQGAKDARNPCPGIGTGQGRIAGLRRDRRSRSLPGLFRFALRACAA
jgi:hypothetical protein